MTESEAIEKLKAYHKCQGLQEKGNKDCHERLCEDCDLCYAQGNTREHIKSIEIAIQALEKRIPKKPIENDTNSFDCPCCKYDLKTDTGNWFGDYFLRYCDNCGQMIDWSDEI